MRRIQCILMAVLAATTASAANGDDDAKPSVKVTLHQMISVDADVNLAATIWRPADAGTVPAVLVLTPYVSDEAHARASKFAQAGYAYVSVDVRGRGSSGGAYRPLGPHGEDGAKVAAWIREQPWSDGRVAMRGGSYRGMTQWQVMAADPEALDAAIPTASAFPGHDFPNPNGILLSYAARWLAFTSGRTRNGNLFGDSELWRRKFVAHYLSGDPFAELAPLAGANSDAFLEWLAHPAYDDYWAARNPGPADYTALDLPLLTVTGYFDGDQPGAMRYYHEYMDHADEAARDDHFLLIGPWDHAGTRQPQDAVGGLSFPDNAVIDMDQLQIDWLDWVLDGGDRPDLLKNRVSYYVMGKDSNEWRHAPSVEAIAPDSLRLYLSSPEGNPGSIYSAGSLVREAGAEEPPDSYRYDPDRYKDREMLMEDRSDRYLVDPVNAHGETVLVYHSDPLPESLTIAGTMRLMGRIALDVPDTDIAAEVEAVLPDGRTLVLGYDAVRARFRNGPQPKPAEPGVADDYLFDDFRFLVRRLPAGTRLRLVVFPLDDPFFLRNYNTGGKLGDEDAKNAPAARVSLMIGGDQPSYLELPLAR